MPDASAPAAPAAVVFDVGNVLFHWDLRYLFDKEISDPARRAHFLGEVLTTLPLPVDEPATVALSDKATPPFRH